MLRLGLDGAIAARGRTALHDAVIEGLSYVDRGALPRRALVVLSDGGDNASRHTLADVEHAAAASSAAVDVVVLQDPANRDGRPGALRRLAALTGALTFDARAAGDIAQAFTAIARDLRNRYTLAYVPSHHVPGLRRVRVTARDPDGRPLRVRTRTAYLAR